MLRPWNRTTAQAVALALLVPFFAACSDENDPSSPAIPSLPQPVVVDLTGGHFTFLTPLGAGSKEGVFNPNLAPVVEICRLATTTQPTAATPCASTVAWFGMSGGSGIERVTVEPRKEMYSVVVNLSRYTLPTGYYRIFVGTARVGTGTTFGFSDVAVAPSSREARTLAGSGMASATATSDLPIKFRLTVGALCALSEDCYEGAVGPAGGVFLTNTEFAGVDFPAGALTDTRTLIVRRVDASDVPYCLPTTEPQYEGCYTYHLEPALAPGETFELEVTVGICLDPAAVPFEDQMVLQKWDEVNPSSLTTLPRREVEFLECEGFSLASIDAAGTFSSLASAGGRFIGSIVAAFLPQPLYAGTKSPYGGGLNDFSRIGWVRPLSIAQAPQSGPALSAATPSACTGSAVAPDPTVVITSDITGEPAAGATVKFALTGGGSTSPHETTSDASGSASTTWTLGDTPGDQTMLAVGLSPRAFPNYTLSAPNYGATIFHATAVDCDD